ncbi:type I DNA topoisomerase [Thermomonospora umbrina]|uniref:DNA topoisomerase 1 n=1 Tax=Thermomonospora umbrina TaxID=111806 RepID=A0A3D9STT2_9ACTN|nr:type I DNA topoisomerase [Thermomonospora umbrina]REE97900.1 DNA topoisomerase I [Thermomonospora umbrina]
MPAKNGTAQRGRGPAAASGGTRLVIVESPAKAKTIAGYLGSGYVVESSIGHIRDIPRPADMPEEAKSQPWAKLGVDVEHDFEPFYVVTADKKSQVAKLRKALKEADELFLATDEDREGEAIAWHLREVLKPKVPVHRMVFNEITPEAIRNAAANPRDLDLKLVDAQETRRILDRLYGFEVSPVLWRKIMQGLSAGRVQSVATRLVVERERERIAFVPAHYWDIEADFATAGTPEDGPKSFTAHLVGVDGRRVAQGRDFSAQGELKAADLLHLDEDAARGLTERLAGRPYAVKSVERKPYTRKPYAPFRTTTMQQEASRKLGFSAKYSMQVAQKLYENGFITYMRTDSINLSATALTAARAQATALYGAQYVPDKPRTYAKKVKNAQEAHEAIRPAGDSFRTPGETGLTGDQFRLYELIWKRTIASQMKDATGQSVSVRVVGTSTAGEEAEFGATGKTITFYGFLKAYVEGADDPETDADDSERRLPTLAEDDPLTAERLEAQGHSTRPPARYTEATLVKELEEREIGRPSTYASILGTILDRGYVFKKGTALVPSFLAFAVVNLLEKHFGHLVDYDFTARMEDSLDLIARGEAERVPWLRRFYFGDGNGTGGAETGLKDLVTDLGEIDAIGVSSFPIKGSDITARVGRYGPYLIRTRDGAEERVNIPEDLAPDELTPDKAEELFAQPSGDRELGDDPESGHPVVAKSGRFGPYVTEVLPEELTTTASGRKKKDAPKPRTASLFKSMSLDTITLDDALKLLALPRTLGELDGEPVTAQNGRFGPYVKKGTDTRSLGAEEDLFTVTLDQAKDLFAQPKQRGRGRAAAAPPLRELGDDPASGKPVVVKEGRFGPYVTDGETNASLRKGDEVESITIQRAAELLAERREKVAADGGKKPAARRAPAKKATTPKKTPAKKPSAKSTS